MRRLTRSALLGPVAALALLAAACGDDEPVAAPAEKETPSEPGASEAESMEVEDGDEDEAASATVTAEDLLAAVEATRASTSAVVELRLGFDGGDLLGSQEVSIAGPVLLDGSQADLSVTVDGTRDNLRLVLVDERSWVGGVGEDVRGAMPEGADWVEVPAADLLASPQFTNPGELAFLYLVGGAQDIESDGDVHTFTLDVEAATAAAPEELREDVASSVTFNGTEEPEITGEVELDEAGRIVALSVLGIQRPSAEEAERFGIEDDSSIRVELDATIDDIDEPVDVREPDGSVVTLEEAPDIAALLALSPR